MKYKFKLPTWKRSRSPTSPVFEHSTFENSQRSSTQFADSHFADSMMPPSEFSVDVDIDELQKTYPRSIAPQAANPNDATTNRMGRAFMAAGKLSADQVAAVLRAQHGLGMRFGEAAIRLGFLTEAEVTSVLAKQFNFQLLDTKGALQSGRISRHLAVAHQPYAAEAEAFRKLRAEVLQRAIVKKGLVVIAVVGTQTKEGCSHVAASLAITLSQMNRRTLLIDANMRRPSLDRMFGISNRFGLSTLLAGRQSGNDREVHAITERLSVLPSGPKPPSPLEILDPPNFQLVLSRFADTHEMVIVDTPAAWDSADALVIALQCTHVLMVVREDHSLIDKIKKTENSLEGLEVVPIGVFYNRIPSQRRWGWFGMKAGPSKPPSGL